MGIATAHVGEKYLDEGFDTATVMPLNEINQAVGNEVGMPVFYNLARGIVVKPAEGELCFVAWCFAAHGAIE